ncbi:flagellar protein FlgN [Microbacterium album]|uniref:Flagellar protein FlgN n=1 Tax=Microbacterium album TaxID=2053191 RepID=A0A917IF34_9MICO|nr:flagellar protein FlgN [Microbacterium album]GGH42890.1 hypothetical protein GCM10010921_16390 [Microbacterium album]
MSDVYVSLTDLRRVGRQLERIAKEFEHAVSVSDALESAIGTPFGRSELRRKAGDIESRWDIQRGRLAQQLTEVKEHVDAVVETVEGFDTEVAVLLDPCANPTTATR